MVKILRHPPLLFWLLTVIMLGLVLGLAMNIGGSQPPAPSHTLALSQHDVAAVTTLSSGVLSLESAVGSKGSVTPLATSLASTAESAAAERQAAAGDDALAVDFRSVASAINQLTEIPATEPVKQVAGLTKVSQAVDAVMADYQRLLAVR